MPLKTYLTKPLVKHQGTIIFFHGSGGTGDVARDSINMLSRPAFTFPHLKVIYPTAPIRKYTPMGGAPSNVWFDRIDISPQVPEHEETLSDIEIEVRKLMKQEHDNGIPSSKIIVGGFSMGGALSLHIGYQWDKQVAGVFVCSSFLNEKSSVYKHLEPLSGGKVPPLLQIHGDADDLVPIDWGKNTFEQLKKYGVRGEFHTVGNLGHSINRSSLSLVREWILKILPYDGSQ